VSALGAAPAAAPADRVTVEPDGAGFLLRNGVLAVRVDGRGLVTGIRDLVADREVLPAGQVANLLQLHPDLPTGFDAWNVDDFYRNSRTDLTEADSVTADGPDRIRVTRRFGASSVTQTIALRPGSRTVLFGCQVDWHEREAFLKAAFPVDVHTDHATAQIQYGHLSRPTHANTSWDAARFEICAHRFLHVGDAGYGVALVNDSTYGHDVTRTPRTGGGTWSTVRLSLLRAPRYPDPETDQGRHEFRYGLACGAGIPDAVREGYRINLPPAALRGGADVEPLVAVDDPAVVVEAVKLADDRGGDLVVRLYESRGGAARTTLSLRTEPGDVVETDLLERPLEGGARFGAGEPVRLSLRPFQIRTLRVARSASVLAKG
jgi:alpha-mannosidase